VPSEQDAHPVGAAVEPGLVAPGDGPLGRGPVVDLLVGALAHQRAAAVAATLLALPDDRLTADARGVARTVDTACRRVAAVATAAEAEVLAVLGVSGIDARPTTSGPIAAHQIPMVDLELPGTQLPRAVDASRALGYHTWVRRSPGALRAHLHSAPAVGLVRDGGPDGVDAPATRLTLRRRAPRATGPVGRRLRPTEADLGFVDLPGPAWPLYHVVRPVRRVAHGLRPPRDEPFAPFLGTPPALVAPLLDLAGVGPDDVLVDLGCGDGRIALEAARLTGCRAVGVERDAALVDTARRRVHEAGLVGRVRIEHGDVRSWDLSGATHVFAFLPGAALRVVLPGALRALPAGGVVLAHEQAALDPPVPPQRVELVVAGASITCASSWTVGARTRGDGTGTAPRRRP
jgi:SAM-dependent methyltransferase